MWSEIGSAHLSSTMQTGCSFNGIATEWSDRNAAAGQIVTIRPGPVSFVNNSPFASAAVPANSGFGLLLTALGVGLVGYLLARR